MKNFLLDCETVVDTAYGSERDESLSVLTHIQIGLHLFFCSSCAEELKKLRYLDEVMKCDFLPVSPNFDEKIMKCLEESNTEVYTGENIHAPAAFSLRGWVIIGFFVLFSLSSSFFGMNFIEIADKQGSSFLLPVGITIGIVLSCYGALFIGSHLKELSSRFGLR